MSSMLPVQLGFSEPLEEPCDIEMVAHNSPQWKDWDGGKIGGKPSWINPRDIPKKILRCVVCAQRNAKSNTKNDGDGNDGDNTSDNNNEGTILRFLTQIYCPADDETESDSAFHRSLYVFCCPHPLCSSSNLALGSVVVLRGQLPQENDFYPVGCEDDDNRDGNELKMWDKHKSKYWDVNLCEVCGQYAKGKCPIAQKYFCCKDHQRDYHKLLKKTNKDEQNKLDVSVLIYAESELVVEQEPEEDKKDTEDQDQVADNVNKTALFAGTDDVDDDGQDDGLLEQTDLNEMIGMDADGTSDQTTLDFYTRISRSGGDVKGQCLRYCRWPDKCSMDEDDENQNGPLWICSTNRPDIQKDIPPCQYCGAERKFEFQIMPQIIHILTKKERSNNGHNSQEIATQIKSSEEAHNALLAASDIIEKAKSEGTEANLPENFEMRQTELVEKFKSGLFNNDDDSEDIDFGTIVVYTCTKSCGNGLNDMIDNDSLGAYKHEFSWRQPPLE